jgi:cytidylate kinase
MLSRRNAGTGGIFMRYKVITVGREYGSGGRFIARSAAEKLSVPFYDKELIELAAEKTGLSEEFVKRAEEHRTSGFLYNLYYPANSLPLYDQVFIAQSNIIRRIASEGPCVIVGRCADHVLQNVPGCLHVFVRAPMEDRIARARNYYGLEGGDDALKSAIVKQDKARASYYNHFTMGKWGMAQNYDLTINSALGIDEAAHAIISLARGVKEA